MVHQWQTRLREFALSGILASLIQRNRTGIGEFIDVSMNDCLISLLYDEAWDCFDELGLEKRQGNRIMRFHHLIFIQQLTEGLYLAQQLKKIGWQLRK